MLNEPAARDNQLASRVRKLLKRNAEDRLMFTRHMTALKT